MAKGEARSMRKIPGKSGAKCKEIIYCLRAGWDTWRIAKDVNASVSYIRKVANENDLEYIRGNVTEEEICDLFRSGCTRHKINSRTGEPKRRIQLTLMKAGLIPNEVKIKLTFSAQDFELLKQLSDNHVKTYLHKKIRAALGGVK